MARWVMKELTLLTISNYKTWNGVCNYRFHLRNDLELVPKVEAHALRFGGFIHEGLHQIRKGQSTENVSIYLETIAPQYGITREDLLKARAMLKGYFNRYGDESAKIVKSEATFSTPIWNPETGHESRTFLRAGKIDAIVQEDNGLWIQETKTTSGLSDGYLMRLWLDSQLTYYSLGAKVAWGMDIKGCVYDLITKSRLAQRKEQSEEDFAQKYAEACAKNKSGKTTLTRTLGESDEEFTARLDEQYADPKMFHRERIFITPEKQELLEREIWSVCAEIRLARRTNFWRRNTDACQQPGRACPYFPICSADGNAETIIQTMYDTKAPNAELLDQESDTET